MKKYRNEILVFMVTFAIILISVLVTFIFFRTRGSLLKDAEEKMQLETARMAAVFEKKICSIQTTVDNLTYIIENYWDEKAYNNNTQAYLDSFEKQFEQNIYQFGLNIEDIKAFYFYFNPDYFKIHYNISFGYIGNNVFERLRILPESDYSRKDIDMSWFFTPIEKKEAIWIEPYYWELFNSYILTYSKPVFVNDQIIGVLGLDLDVNELISFLNNFNDYENGHAFLLNQDYDFIVHRSFDSGTHFFETSMGNAFNKRDFTNNERDENHIVFSEDQVIAYSQLSNQWTLMLSALKSDIFKPFRDFVFYMVLISLFMIIVAIILSRFLSFQISKPLESLASRIRNFDILDNQKLEKATIHELDAITNSFNHLSGSLSESYALIKKKNTELEDTFSELEISYNELENLAENLENILNLTSSISIMAVNNETEYLEHILSISMNYSNEADKGVILRFSNNNWEEIFKIGYDNHSIQNRILKGLNQLDLKELNVQTEKKIPDGISLYTPLVFGENLLGAIILTKTKNHKNHFSEENQKFVRAFSNLAASFFGIQRMMHIKTKFRESILFSMIKLVELHDPYTRGHSENVSNISVLIAKEMGLNQTKISMIKWAGLVHDIGKILVPKAILTKPSQLDEEEYNIIKKHPEYGAKVLTTSEEISEVSNIVKYHHERWDGKGYPDGLKGELIPLESRIISVADAYDAMVSNRPYRKGLSLETAYKELQYNAGKQFDPDVVAAFLKIKKITYNSQK